MRIELNGMSVEIAESVLVSQLSLTEIRKLEASKLAAMAAENAEADAEARRLAEVAKAAADRAAARREEVNGDIEDSKATLSSLGQLEKAATRPTWTPILAPVREDGSIIRVGTKEYESYAQGLRQAVRQNQAEVQG